MVCHSFYHAQWCVIVFIMLNGRIHFDALILQIKYKGEDGTVLIHQDINPLALENK